MHDGAERAPSLSPMLENTPDKVPGNDFELDEEDEGDDSSYAMLDFVSFEGHDDLLRGVRLSTIMQGAGRIFRSSRGSADTYSLSYQVQSLGYFISHNWSTRRSFKYIALAFKFNFQSAFLAALTCLAVCTATSLLGCQPGFASPDAEYPVSISCRLLVVPCTLIGLLAGGQLRWRWRSPEVFLDKACIDQSSEEAQRVGIQKLGAFLRSSHRMLALFSPVYLTKLWTSFEVAGFLTMHDLRDLELLPLMLPICFLAMLAMHFGYLVFHVSWRLCSLPGAWHHVVTMGGAMIYMLLVRQWTKQKAQIAELLRTFEVRKATCALESDRPIVYNNIAVLFKASGHVPKTATVEEALDAFDHQVRVQMSDQFRALFGRSSFSYQEHLLLSLTSFTAVFLDDLGQIGHGAPWEKVLRGHVCDPFWIFTGLTLWQFSTEAIASRFHDLEGWRELLFMFCIVSTVCPAGVAILGAAEHLGARAQTDDTLFFCCLATVTVTTLLSLYGLPRLLSKNLRSRRVCSPDEGEGSEQLAGSCKATFSVECNVSKKSSGVGSFSLSSNSRLSSKDFSNTTPSLRKEREALAPTMMMAVSTATTNTNTNPAAAAAAAAELYSPRSPRLAPRRGSRCCEGSERTLETIPDLEEGLGSPAPVLSDAAAAAATTAHTTATTATTTTTAVAMGPEPILGPGAGEGQRVIDKNNVQSLDVHSDDESSVHSAESSCN